MSPATEAPPCHSRLVGENGREDSIVPPRHTLPRFGSYRPEPTYALLTDYQRRLHAGLLCRLLSVLDRNNRTESGTFAYKSKVRPPRLDGRSVGVFGTRSPHRPCPIGLSLVRLDAVKGKLQIEAELSWMRSVYRNRFEDFVSTARCHETDGFIHQIVSTNKP